MIKKEAIILDSLFFYLNNLHIGYEGITKFRAF